MDKKYTILIIDDKAENLKYLKEVLKEEKYKIKATIDAQFAIDSILENPVDLILLDIKMPVLNGFDVCKIIKQNDKLKDIPIIFISALDDVDIKVKAFENGGVDYITKPFEEREVKARIKTQLELSTNKKTISTLYKQQDFFLKKIIHEMNTPLGIITLNVNSLESNLGLKDEFEAIKASCKSLSSIYEDIYYLSKKEKRILALEEIDMMLYLSKRVSFFDELATVKDIDIELHLEDDFSINMNKYELERVIDNTLSNAIKHSFNETTIDIYLEKNRVRVQNYGHEIKSKDEIFKAFHQDDNEKGLGLGLSIIKEICEKYNIKIELETNKKYTEFSYDFSHIIVG
ncbi:hybrid sensor histidine kinase/response regulator [Poseidonibacter ostreae]|jgi:two-component system, sensor histidine kinase and response regulator|uniref:histidine kinase n=1 Tax=Poseidonibacter ostreae TaxID=2654171 RepID=A0A6L4WST8_9BACT|nr:hybrid sensor histidine kinase/response regulator [Poseidonibacter ostreae]KAB7884428.1 response regulator [Poseidonibacter ostreae]KAB7888786.1 response regulator [Poseidonibacter ostreae]KAB7891183.1 response regulator [Poseidonibacter ostreae]MAC84865.1 hybrid sensor histidine kinase/response regulator [Arcobacter sp.]|tara:strand:- start:5950 stop:6984 length:1035 start_codon:yes stop_codon:yes gene_type:complete